MDAEPSERFVLIADRSQYPLSSKELVEYALHELTLSTPYKRPPEAVSNMVHDSIMHAEQATAIFHPEYGWFVLKESGVIIGWWKKTYLGG